DLETNRIRWQLMCTGLLPNEVQEAFRVERAAGHVDRASQRAASFADHFVIAGEYPGDDPAVDRGHQVVTLRCWQEAAGQDQIALLVDHSEQDFQMLGSSCF